MHILTCNKMCSRVEKQDKKNIFVVLRVTAIEVLYMSHFVCGVFFVCKLKERTMMRFNELTVCVAFMGMHFNAVIIIVQ